MEELITYCELYQQYLRKAENIADKLIKSISNEGFVCMHSHQMLISVHLDGMYRFDIKVLDKSVIKSVYSGSNKADTWTEEDYENTKNKLLELFKGGA